MRAEQFSRTRHWRSGLVHDSRVVRRGFLVVRCCLGRSAETFRAALGPHEGGNERETSRNAQEGWKMSECPESLVSEGVA